MSLNEPRWDIPPQIREGKFKQDLAYGKAGEEWVECILNGGSEIKTDAQFAKTGNFYIEFEQCLRGEWVPSGISITKAKFLFIKFGLHPQGYVCSMDHVKKACKIAAKNKNKIKETRKPGNPATRGFILTPDDLFDVRDKSLDGK